MTLSSVGKFIALTLLTAVPGFSQVPAVYSFSPPTLIVGSPPLDLKVQIGDLASGLVIRWNGEERPTSVIQSGTLDVRLGAADMVAPGLAEVTVYDPQAAAVVADSFIGIGYNVVPLGMVYDSTRKRFYVVTPPDSKDPRFPPNSVVAFDPDAGTTSPMYTAANYLGQAALSSDASLLYVIDDGDSVVLCLDPQTLSLRSSFGFRGPTGKAPPYGFGYPSTLAVMPGQPGTVAVNYARIFGDPTFSLGIFDNGVERLDEALVNGPGVLFSSDGKYVYLRNLPNAGQKGVLRLAVDGSGFVTQDGTTGMGGIPTAVVNGVVYTASGIMIDAATMQPVGDLGVSGSVAVNADNRRILVLVPGSTEALQAFDLAGFNSLGSIPLPGIDAGIAISFYTFPPYRQLIAFGADGVLYQSTNALVPFHTRLAAPPPAISAASIVNSASSAGGAVAPGELVTIYGSSLGPSKSVAAQLAPFAVPDSLANVQVLFDQKPGNLLLVGQGQINAIAPFELQPGSTVHVQVLYQGLLSERIAMPVVAAAPGLFTQDGSGKGLAAVINQDGSVNAPSVPGSYVTLYGTGGGLVQGAADGQIAGAAANLNSAVQLNIDGQNAVVSYAGAAPTLPDGVFQINAVVPTGVRSGVNVPLSLTIGGQTGVQAVTLAIR